MKYFFTNRKAVSSSLANQKQVWKRFLLTIAAGIIEVVNNVKNNVKNKLLNFAPTY